MSPHSCPTLVAPAISLFSLTTPPPSPLLRSSVAHAPGPGACKREASRQAGEGGRGDRRARVRRDLHELVDLFPGARAGPVSIYLSAQ